MPDFGRDNNRIRKVLERVSFRRLFSIKGHFTEAQHCAFTGVGTGTAESRTELSQRGMVLSIRGYGARVLYDMLFS